MLHGCILAVHIATAAYQADDATHSPFPASTLRQHLRGHVRQMSIARIIARASGISVLSWPDPDPKSYESREECVRKDLTRRLTHVCENLSPADFEALVVQMTREQLRGEGLTGRKIRRC
jgi:hypothetical protein